MFSAKDAEFSKASSSPSLSSSKTKTYAGNTSYVLQARLSLLVSSNESFQVHRQAIGALLDTPFSDEVLLTKIIEALPIYVRTELHDKRAGAEQCLVRDCAFAVFGSSAKCEYHTRRNDDAEYRAVTDALVNIMFGSQAIDLLTSFLSSSSKSVHKLLVCLLWMLNVPHQRCRLEPKTACKRCSRGAARFMLALTDHLQSCGSNPHLQSALCLLLTGQPGRVIQEPFSTQLVGGRVQYPAIWDALLSSLSYSNEQDRVAVLREMNCLLIANEANCDSLLLSQQWRTQLLLALPAMSNDIDLDLADSSPIVALTVNIFSEIACHSLLNRSDFVSGLESSCASISSVGEGCSWAAEITRLLLTSLCAKIQGAKTQLKDNAMNIADLTSLANIIRRFMFLQPEIGARPEDDHMIVRHRVMSAKKIASGKIREEVSHGIHWSISGNCADLPVSRKAQAMLATLVDIACTDKARKQLTSARNYFSDATAFLENLPSRYALRVASQMRKDIDKFSRKTI